MNIVTLTNYVNQDIDDTYTVQEVTQWFNKGISQYNLIPPLTVYPIVTYGGGTLNEQANYPLDETFLLGVMLPFITSSIRGSESAITERQLFLQEYMMNAMNYKRSIDIPTAYMRNQKNDDLSIYEIGEGVFLTDFTKAPFAGEWQRPSRYTEIIPKRNTIEDEE
jgi:hypothetical protein